MTVHPHFRRILHLLYRTETGAIFAIETSPSTALPSDIGSISVPDQGVIPTSRTHRIDVTATPHSLVELTEAERLDANRPNNVEVTIGVARELAVTDQFMAPDRPMSEDQRAAWTAYRQALRDLSKSDPVRGRVRTTVEMIQDWPIRPDGADAIQSFRSRI